MAQRRIRHRPSAEPTPPALLQASGRAAGKVIAGAEPKPDDGRCTYPGCIRERAALAALYPMCFTHAMDLYETIAALTPASDGWEALQDYLNDKYQAYLKEQRAKRETLKSRPDQPGWIYYIQFGDQIKIGYSRDVHRRIREFSANGVLLAVHPGTLSTERDMHRRFGEHLAARKEYFTDCPELRAHITQVIEQFGPPAEPGPTQTSRPPVRIKHSVRHIA